MQPIAGAARKNVLMVFPMHAVDLYTYSTLCPRLRGYKLH